MTGRGASRPAALDGREAESGGTGGPGPTDPRDPTAGEPAGRRLHMDEGSLPAPADEFVTPDQLLAFLRPRGIAVVGASAEAGKFSTRLIPSLIACGYAGGIYPVNPRYAEVAGLPCYPSVAALPAPCDLIIVAVPARHVPGVVGEAAGHGVRGAIILSGGFAEIGGAGAARQRDLRALAGPLRLYGPNCPGLWQIRDGLVYTFSAQFDPTGLVAGPIGLVTQGGALGRTVLDAMQTGLGFSYWFSTGNEADLDAADFVSFLADDPGTAAVALIVEGWRDGRRFLRAVARCRAAAKPVLLLKIGRTVPGAAAARAHTAATNGSQSVADAALRRAGCIRVDDVDELTAVARLLARHPRPGPGGLGICSFSGGAGSLLADLAHTYAVPLPDLWPGTRSTLRDLVPEIATVGNPTDLTTAALEDLGLARRAVEIMVADPGLAAVLFPLPHRLDAFDERMAQHLVEVAAASDKPVAVLAASPVFQEEAAARILRDGRVPVFCSAHLAVRAVAGWLRARDAAAVPPYAPGGRITPNTAAVDVSPVSLEAVLDACGIPHGEPGRNGQEKAGDAWLSLPRGFDLRCTVEWDAAFGPAVTCGAGGVWGLARPEDRAARLAPFDMAEAQAMLGELRCLVVLHAGAAGGDPYDLEAAAQVLVRLGTWAAAAPGPFHPIEIDPLRILPAGNGVTAIPHGAPRHGPHGDGRSA